MASLGRIATIENDADDAIIRQFERAVQLDDGKAVYHGVAGAPRKRH